MIAAVFVRTLKDGVTFEEFEEAWAADKGYGVPTRVFNAVNVENPREVLSVGFVAVPGDAMRMMLAEVQEGDQERHDRVDEVIESTELKAMYELGSEHDFTTDPRSIAMFSGESLFAAFPDLSMEQLTEMYESP